MIHRWLCPLTYQVPGDNTSPVVQVVCVPGLCITKTLMEGKADW